MDIEVLDIKPLDNAGTLKALVSVRIGAITINDCKIICQEGRRPWLGLPSKEYQSKSGDRRFSPIVELPDALRAELSRLVLSAWEKHERGARPSYRATYEQ
jgi:hypothetical protein